MPVNIDISIRDHGLQALSHRIEKRLVELKPVLNVIGETIQASIDRNFEKGGRPAKWQSLSPVTRVMREKRGKWPGQTLIVSGALRRINYKTGSDRVTFSANQVYAATQHFGAKKGSFGTFSITQQIKEHIRTIKGKKQTVKAHTRTRDMKLPWGDIPARPFMMVQKEDWDEIKDALADLLLGK